MDARSAPTMVLAEHLHARDSIEWKGILQMRVGPLVEAMFELTTVDTFVDPTTVTAERRGKPLRPAEVVPRPSIAPARATGTVRATGRGLA